MKIALVHYAYPPVIGGVEFVMEQQAALFVRRGHAVRIVAGRAESSVEGIRVDEIEELLPTHPRNEQSQSEITGNGAATAYGELKAFLKGRLGEILADCQVVIVHNMMTMHFNLAASAALAELAKEGWQILYFTFDPALRDRLARLDATVIELPPPNRSN